MSDVDFTGMPALRFNGNSHRPEALGVIPGVTPRTDEKRGLEPGEIVVITDELLASLNRPTGEQAAADFAEFIAGVYNANYRPDRWSAIIVMPPAEKPPEEVQSEQAEDSVVEPTDEVVDTKSGRSKRATSIL